MSRVWRAIAALSSLCAAGLLLGLPPDPAGLEVRHDARAAQEGPPAPRAKEKPKEKLPEDPPATFAPGYAVAVAHKDASRIAAADERRGASLGGEFEPDAPFQRYFLVQTPKEKMDDFLVAFCLHLNLLSDQGPIKWPVVVAPRVLRIDVRHYGWDRNEKLEKVYEKAANLDFMFHQKAKLQKDARVAVHSPAGTSHVEKKAGDSVVIPAVWLPQAQIDALREMLCTEVPVLGAEWLFVQSARQVSIRNVQEGLGYYDFLGLRNRDDFFRLTGTKVETANAIYRRWKAAIVKSGISQQNRLVIAFGSHSGRVWGTLDTFRQQGAGVARRNLRDGEFDHDAEEWYGFLPNGLWLTALVQAKDVGAVKAGSAVESAPDKVGPDDSIHRVGRDARVHANLSCIRCHSPDKDGLKPLDDWARKTFRRGGVLSLTDPTKHVQQELESDYLRDIDSLLGDDRTLYRRAVVTATASAKNPKGLSVAEAGRLYAEAWNRYVEEDLSAADAARELGHSEKALLDGIKAYVSGANRGAGDLVVASFLDGQKIPRLDWEDSYQLAAALAMGLNPPDVPQKEKVKDPFEAAGRKAKKKE